MMKETMVLFLYLVLFSGCTKSIFEKSNLSKRENKNYFCNEKVPPKSLQLLEQEYWCK